MKRFVMGLIVGAILSLSFAVFAAGWDYTPITNAFRADRPVYVEGKNINDGQYPVINYKPDGAQYPYLYIPLAALKDLGMEVQWDEATMTATAGNPLLEEIAALRYGYFPGDTTEFKTVTVSQVYLDEVTLSDGFTFQGQAFPRSYSFQGPEGNEPSTYEIFAVGDKVTYFSYTKPNLDFDISLAIIKAADGHWYYVDSMHT